MNQFAAGLGGRSVSMQLLEPRRMMSFTPVGGEVALGVNGAYQSYDIGVAGDGSAWAATVETYLSPSLNRNVNVLSAQQYDSLGRPAGAKIVLSRYAQTNAAVSVDVNDAGQAVIAYVERFGDVETLSVRRLDTIGLGEGAYDPLRIFTKPVTTGGDAQFSSFRDVAVSIANNGAFFVAHRAANSADLQVQYLEAGNDRSPTVLPALDHLAAEYDTLGTFDIDARPDGSGTMFSASIDNGLQEIFYGSVSTTAGADDVRRVILVTDPVNPSIAVTADGGFVIAFADNTLADNFGGAGVVVKRYDAAGNDLSPVRPDAGLDPAGIPMESSGADVTAMPDGGFVVSFVQYGDEVSASSPAIAYARRYAADGAADESGAAALGTASIGGTAVDVDAYGNALVAYAKPGTEGASSPAKVVGLRHVTTGSVSLGGEVFVVGTSGNDVIRLDDVDGNGRVRVVINGQSRRYRVGHVAAMNLLALAGNDRVDILRAIPATLSGGSGNDTILGSAADDSITGDGGNDRLYANDGIDYLDGGSNSDFLRGGAGDDYILGGTGAGKDLMFGDGGNDYFNGYLGVDRIFGGDGEDRAARDVADIVDGVETF